MTIFTVRNANLEDLARNVAGIDDHWLINASHVQLQRLVKELREEARAALEKVEDRP
jgi:hypothetical protein